MPLKHVAWADGTFVQRLGPAQWAGHHVQGISMFGEVTIGSMQEGHSVCKQHINGCVMAMVHTCVMCIGNDDDDDDDDAG